MSDVKEEKFPITSVKLFVGDLSVRFTREMLFDLFKVYGKVTEVNINHGTQDDKLFTGFGFVSFSSKEMASLAKHSLNATLHYGRKLRIGWAGRDEELLERPSTVVELFFSFKSSKMKHFLYEQTIRELVAEFTDCEVLDVAMKSYTINTHIPTVFGAGFVHFPVTRQGVAAAKLISNELKRVTIQDIHYDCKLAHSLQSLLESIPELREDSNSKDILTVEKGDNSEQVEKSISESTTADSIVTCSETGSMRTLNTDKHEKVESGTFTGTGWTSDSVVQLQNKTFSYATFREMMHLIPSSQSSSATRNNVDRLLWSPSNKCLPVGCSGGDQLSGSVSGSVNASALHNLSLQHPPKQHSTAVRIEQYPNNIACASPNMMMSVGQYSSFNSPSSPSVAFGLQQPLSEQLFQQPLLLHTQHHQQSQISQQRQGGGELTLTAGYYGLPPHMSHHHQQQGYIGQSQQRAEYLRDLHQLQSSSPQLQSCYSPPYGPVTISSGGYPYHQGFMSAGQELFHVSGGGGATTPYNLQSMATTLPTLLSQPSSPQQLQQPIPQSAWGGNAMDNTQAMSTYVGGDATHMQCPLAIGPYIQPPVKAQSPQQQHVIPAVDRSANPNKPALFSNRRYNRNSSVAIRDVQGRGGGGGSHSEKQTNNIGSQQLSSVSMPPFRPPVQQQSPRFFNRHYSSMSPPRPSFQSTIDHSTSVGNYTVNNTATTTNVITMTDVTVPTISNSNTCTTTTTTLNDDTPSTSLANYNP